MAVSFLSNGPEDGAARRAPAAEAGRNRAARASVAAGGERDILPGAGTGRNPFWPPVRGVFTRSCDDLLMPTPRRPLVLWDIDHTLIRLPGVSQRIYALAFEQAVGRPLAVVADMAGRTDRAIVADTLALNGAAASGVTFEHFVAALADAAHALRDEMRDSGQVLPGAAEALKAFAADGALQTVVTGNSPAIAVTKLEALELTDILDLEVGGYGDDDADRAVLVCLAVARAGAKYQAGFTPEDAIVIGDTPHDVKGALDTGALAVGVATGRSSEDELRAAGARLVLPDLSDISSPRKLVAERSAA
ncbi:MAG TPA: haloacid dehalogenase-like hydrolase [Actinocrinis sp.]